MYALKKYKSSECLKPNENYQMNEMLGDKTYSVATTVAQVYAGIDGEWVFEGGGILCFIRDHLARSYYFRLYSLITLEMLWEEKLYKRLEYYKSNNFFHQFEGRQNVIGFNFANEKEAAEFHAIVKKQFQSKTNQVVEAKPLVKRKVSKSDISKPVNFKHVAHLGLNKPCFGQDPDLIKLFEKAGITEKQLNDEDTKKFIYKFIERKGGSKAVKHSINPEVRKVPNRAAPGIPMLLPPPIPEDSEDKIHKGEQITMVPPPPISNTNNKQCTVLPPPPPPTTPITIKKQSAVLPPPPPMQNTNDKQRTILPPPPPPIHFNGILPPPPALPTESEDNESIQIDSRGDLLGQIQRGINLKPVESVAEVTVSRNGLLQEIEKGMKLKPANERTVKAKANEEESCNDLASALKRALDNRNRAVYSSDEDESSSFDDGEWED